MTGHDVLVDRVPVVVDRCGDRVHHVTTSDSVSGSIRWPVPVVTVLATRCIWLLLASRGPPPVTSRNNKVLSWLGPESASVTTGVEGRCGIK